MTWRTLTLLALTSGLAFAQPALSGKRSTSSNVWQPQQQSRVFTPLAVNSDDTVNPMRGYHRWRNQELVPQSAPAQDAYQRYNWNQLETGPGQYNFTPLLNDLQTARSQGRKFSFRVRAMVGYEDGLIYLPADLPNNPQCQAGCGWWSDADATNPKNTYVPDWNDPYLQQRARAMLAALAQAIGNAETIGWIDVGMYGQYGEWALSSSINYATAPAGIVPASNASKREFAKMHFDAFPNRQHVMFALYGNHDSLLYGLHEQTITQKPVGLRIDCLGRASFMNQWLSSSSRRLLWEQYYAPRWQSAPFVAEFCPFTPGHATDNPQAALQQVRDFHISSVSNGNLAKDISASQSWAAFSSSEQAALLQLGREAGYRLLPENVSINLNGSGLLALSLSLRNDGNAPSYEPWDAMLELVNSSGQIVWSGNSGFPIKQLLGGGGRISLSPQYQLPVNLAAGQYQLRLVLRDQRRVSDPLNIRAILKLVIAERDSDGGVLLGTLLKN